MTHPFDATGLEILAPLAAQLAKDGIAQPTAVQQAAIPPILAGKDVVIQSGTGTGKTLAYLLPLIERARRDAGFRVVVLAPSPELALQILRVGEAYKGAGVRSASLVGSGNIERQKDKLKQHPQLIVGTPGRVLEMIFARKLPTRSIKALVLDEIDQVLSEQNDAELREVMSRPEFESQLVVASATVRKRADAFIADHMAEDRVRLHLDASPLRQSIQHHYLLFPDKRSELVLARLVRDLDIEAALVFVHKRYSVAKLFHALTAQQIPCVTLTGEGNKLQRQTAIEAFRRHEARVLVATDLAARGLDIPELAWVIHFELANDKDAYLHRTGRTGRAGNTGTSIAMITRDELATLEHLARELRIEITPMPKLASRRR